MSKQRRILASLLGVLAVVAATLVPGGPAASAPTGDLASWTTATVPLPTGGAAYDATRDRVLVTVPGSVPGLGNRLVEIDPQTGARGRDVFVGSQPEVVAVADDGSRAYIGLGGAPVVVEVDLAAFTVTRSFPVGGDSSGPWMAADIEVQPGSPGTVAVSRSSQCCNHHEGVAIFDDGVQRATATAGHSGSDRITWSDDPAELYGNNGVTNGLGFYRLAVDGAGVTVVEAEKGLINGAGVDIEFGAGLVHATNGTVVDPSTMTEVGAYAATGALAVDEVQDRTFLLSGGALRRHDTTTFLVEDTRTVPNLEPRDLLDAGDVLVAAGPAGILLVGPGVSDAGYVVPDAPASIVRPWDSTTVDLSANEIVASPDGSVLYAVVGSGAPAHAGEVVEVDVAAGTVGRSVSVGANPQRIAVSDDGSTLMIGHRDASRLTEVDVATFAVLGSVAIDAGWWAGDIDAQPGTARTFVAVLFGGGSPSLRGSILVRDGVIATERGPGHTGPTSITFAGDPTLLYGHNGGTTDYGFSTLAVAPDGLTMLSSQRRVLSGFGLELVDADGMVYASNGGLVDPTVPARRAMFGSSGQPVPVPSQGRVLFVYANAVHEYELDGYAKVGTSTFFGGTTRDATLAGTTLAVATSSQKVVLIPLGPDERVPPGPPSAVTAVAGNGQASVSWTEPVDDGGSPVTAATVTASPGGATCTTAGTSCVVDGLVNGTTYTFTVVAANAKGPGAASVPSDPVTPAGPPGAPGAPAVVPGDGEVEVSWSAPVADGGDPVNAYVATAQPGGVTCHTTTGTTCTIEGLGNGITHTVSVRAINTRGPGPASPLSEPVVPTACEGSGLGPFPDVGAGHRFCSEVEWMVARDLTGGYPDGGFHPTAGLSRQAVAAFLHRFEGRPAVVAPVFPTFFDVEPGHAFYAEIEWLAGAGLANGYADGTYRPTAGVTRQSLAAMLHRLAGLPSVPLPGTPTFSDVRTSHPFRTEIEWLAATGISTGYDDGSFRPGEPISRQAMSAFLQRFAALA
jgi:hypothetical protein